jgi:hypothetical protein
MRVVAVMLVVAAGLAARAASLVGSAAASHRAARAALQGGCDFPELVAEWQTDRVCVWPVVAVSDRANVE